jgi:hypothetical protein
MKHTSVAIVLTIFAVVLAMYSLTMPYYQVTDGYVDLELRVHYNTVEFYPTYYIGDEGTRDYSSYYGEVGGLMGLTMILIWVWALSAMAYVWRVLHVDESEFKWWQGGFVAGWVLLATAVLPALVFALFIDGAYTYDVELSQVDGFIGSVAHDEWGPMLGWVLLALACLIQSVAVLARNVPSIVRWSKGPDEVPPEMAARGDLPVR